MILVNIIFPSNRSPAAFMPVPSLFDAIFVYSTIDRTLEHRSHSSVLGPRGLDSSILASIASDLIAADSCAYYSTL